MQKHQQWIDNRMYQQHLQCIKRIKLKKKTSMTTNNHMNGMFGAGWNGIKARKLQNDNYFQSNYVSKYNSHSNNNLISQTNFQNKNNNESDNVNYDEDNQCIQNQNNPNIKQIQYLNIKTQQNKQNNNNQQIKNKKERKNNHQQIKKVNTTHISNLHKYKKNKNLNDNNNNILNKKIQNSNEIFYKNDQRFKLALKYKNANDQRIHNNNNENQQKQKIYQRKSYQLKANNQNLFQNQLQDRDQGYIINQNITMRNNYQIKKQLSKTARIDNNSPRTNCWIKNNNSSNTVTIKNNKLFNLKNNNIISPQFIQRNSTFMTLKEKQLILNNFMLGKRIIQTTPVICKKKLDQEYRKHKQLLKSRTIKKPTPESNNYRLKKLQQHNNEIEKIFDQHRVQFRLHKKYVMNLRIQSIQIFKYKFSSFENIILTMKTGKKEILKQRATQVQNEGQQQKLYETIKPQSAPLKKKQPLQVSQCISSSILTSYNFFFSLKKHILQQNIPIIIQLKNVKSLNVISIGTFSFQFNNKFNLDSCEAKLYGFGKLIGNIKFSAFCGKKDNFITN